MPQPLRYELRDFVADHFNRDEFGLLCSDYFPDFYRDYAGTNTSFTKLVNELIEYSERNGRFDDLCTVVSRARVEPYVKRFGSSQADDARVQSHKTQNTSPISAAPSTAPRIFIVAAIVSIVAAVGSTSNNTALVTICAITITLGIGLIAVLSVSLYQEGHDSVSMGPAVMGLFALSLGKFLLLFVVMQRMYWSATPILWGNSVTDSLRRLGVSGGTIILFALAVVALLFLAQSIIWLAFLRHQSKIISKCRPFANVNLWRFFKGAWGCNRLTDREYFYQWVYRPDTWRRIDWYLAAWQFLVLFTVGLLVVDVFSFLSLASLIRTDLLTHRIVIFEIILFCWTLYFAWLRRTIRPSQL